MDIGKSLVMFKANRKLKSMIVSLALSSHELVQ